MDKQNKQGFSPPKGKPSAPAKEEGLGLQATEPGKLEENEAMRQKYTEGEETAPNANMQHPNRNRNKEQDEREEPPGGWDR